MEKIYFLSTCKKKYFVIKYMYECYTMKPLTMTLYSLQMQDMHVYAIVRANKNNK